MVVLQYVIQPLTPKEQKVQADLLSRIVNDEPVFQQIQATRKEVWESTVLVWALRILLFIPFPWLVIAYYLVKPLIKKRTVVYTQGQKELLSSVKFKLEQPLYTVAIRAIIRGASEKPSKKRYSVCKLFSPHLTTVFRLSSQSIKPFCIIYLFPETATP